MNSITINFSRKINDLSFIFDFETLTRISINIDHESHLENINSELFFQRMQNSTHICHVIINIRNRYATHFDIFHKFLNHYIDTIEINYFNSYDFKDSNFIALIDAIANYPNITKFDLKCVHHYFPFDGGKFTVELLYSDYDVTVNSNNLYDFFQNHDPNFSHDRCINIVDAINRPETIPGTHTHLSPVDAVSYNRVSLSTLRSFFNESEMNNLCDVLSQTNLIKFRIKLCIKSESCNCQIFDLFSDQQRMCIDNCMIRTNVKSARNTNE